MSTVSILMPVKNTAQYLRQCIDSILKQTHSDWELIAINDNSTDNSLEILRAYTSQDSRITAIDSNGQGIIAALSQAYTTSKGSYITRMDSDDLMSPQKLELFVQVLMDAGKGHLTTGLVKYISEDNLGDGYQRYEAWLNELSLREANFSDIYKECSIASPNWMLHRSDFERCGAFRSDIYPEDYDLCFRFKRAGLKLKNVQSLTHYWRDYPTRTSRTDANYSDNKFSVLKIHHFLGQDYNPDTSLVLWGAGKKGKALAKELSNHNIPFRWLCNNPKKIGKEIYEVQLESIDVMSSLTMFQLILAISQEGYGSEIAEITKGITHENIFHFC